MSEEKTFNARAILCFITGFAASNEDKEAHFDVLMHVWNTNEYLSSYGAALLKKGVSFGDIMEQQYPLVIQELQNQLPWTKEVQLPTMDGMTAEQKKELWDRFVKTMEATHGAHHVVHPIQNKPTVDAKTVIVPKPRMPW